MGFVSSTVQLPFSSACAPNTNTIQQNVKKCIILVFILIVSLIFQYLKIHIQGMTFSYLCIHVLVACIVVVHFCIIGKTTFLNRLETESLFRNRRKQHKYAKGRYLKILFQNRNSLDYTF